MATRYDNRSAEYVLVVSWSADRRQEERFATAVLLRKRLLGLETQIGIDGRQEDGPPIILSTGWPDKRPIR
jgi:hypothetical protein